MATVAKMTVRILGDKTHFDKTMKDVGKTAETIDQKFNKLDPSVQKVVDRFRKMRMESTKTSTALKGMSKVSTTLTTRLGGMVGKVTALATKFPGWTKVIGVATVALFKLGQVGLKALDDMDKKFDAVEAKRARMTDQEITIAGGKTSFAEPKRSTFESIIRYLSATSGTGAVSQEVFNKTLRSFDRGKVTTQEIAAERRERQDRLAKVAEQSRIDKLFEGSARAARTSGPFTVGDTSNEGFDFSDSNRRAVRSSLGAGLEGFRHSRGFAGIAERALGSSKNLIKEFTNEIGKKLIADPTLLTTPAKSFRERFNTASRAARPGVEPRDRLLEILESDSQAGYKQLRSSAKGDRRSAEGIEKIKDSTEDTANTLDDMFKWFKKQTKTTLSLPG